MPKKKLPKKPYLTVGEVAKLLEVSRQRVQQWIDAGRMPTAPGGPPWLIPTEQCIRPEPQVRGPKPSEKENFAA